MVLVPAVVLAGVAAVGTATAVAALAWRRRPTPGARPLAALMTAVAAWIAVRLVRVFTVGEGPKVALGNVEWVAINVAALSWFAFTLTYTGRRSLLRPATLVGLAVVPAATVVGAVTDPAHGLFRAGVAVADVGGLSVLSVETGPIYWIGVAYLYGLILVGAALLVHSVLAEQRRYRWQAVALLVAALVPTAVQAPYAASVVSVDPTPVVLPVTGVAALVAVRRYGLLDAQPLPSHVVRRAVVERMDDAVVVVDDADRVVDANPAARGMLSITPGDARASAALPDEAATPGRYTVPHRVDGRTRWLDVRVSRLDEADGRLSGRLVVARDVTDRRTRTQRLSVLNRVLRHDLRNRMNVIHGHASGMDGEPARVVERNARRVVRLCEEARVVESLLADQGDERGSVDVAALLSAAADRARSIDPAARVTVDVDVPPGTACDAGVAPAIGSLVDNAVEHNDRAAPTVRLSATLEAGAEDGGATDAPRVAIRVADDGPGIPESERAIVEREAEGPLDHANGLGLWLVQWGTTAVDGEVAFADRDPRGTTVTVHVPAIGDPAVECPPDLAAVSTPSSRRSRVAPGRGTDGDGDGGVPGDRAGGADEACGADGEGPEARPGRTDEAGGDGA